MTKAVVLAIIEGEEFEEFNSLHIVEHRYRLGTDIIQLFWATNGPDEPVVELNGVELK
jgi:hypothetical protein